eukprot:4879097-Alexandrium_andersonii.AAC.1
MCIRDSFQRPLRNTSSARAPCCSRPCPARALGSCEHAPVSAGGGGPWRRSPSGEPRPHPRGRGPLVPLAAG